jgi:hypothetical protein
MRKLSLSIILSCACLSVLAQSQQSDEAPLSKTRALYDAPFTRGMVSFDCAVQFDWKKHFVETLGQVPPAALPTVDRLQKIEHRIFVDRSGAVVSETPKGADLEQALQAMVSAGLNAWLPFATNVILPVKPTKASFQTEGADYKLIMSGTNVAATLILASDMRITSGVSTLPQPLRFETEFIGKSGGYLLQSLKTSSDISPDAKWESSFEYAYQTVQEIQLPSLVMVTQHATPETWLYSLNDCKAVTGVTLRVEAPKQ